MSRVQLSKRHSNGIRGGVEGCEIRVISAWLIFALVCLFPFQNCFADESNQLDRYDTETIEFFQEVGFSCDTYDEKRIRKWLIPINIYMDVKEAPSLKKEISKSIGHIRQVTGHDINTIDNNINEEADRNYNLLIIISEDIKKGLKKWNNVIFDDMLNGSLDYDTIKLIDDIDIIHFNFFHKCNMLSGIIVVENNSKTLKNINYELMRVLGFDKSKNDKMKTVLTKGSEYFSYQDNKMLRILYNKNIKPRYSIEQFTNNLKK